MDYNIPERVDKSNKSTYGKVLNIAGSDYMPGAAYLSSIAALKIGCGYCYLLTSDEARRSIAAQTSAIVFVPPENAREAIKNADVIEFGCGLNSNNNATEYFYKLLDCARQHTPILFDAGAFPLLVEEKFAFDDKYFTKTIFTPHPKEAAILLECDLKDVLNNIEHSAKKISKKYRCVTVLKTEKTFITSPEGQCYINTTGNNALAKAGSGDVLSGIISGLLAQKMEIFEAACLGTYLHGLCGEIAAKNLTKYSVLPQDLIDTIPKAIKAHQNCT